MKRNDTPPTLRDIMKMVERDNRCANAALIISCLSLLVIIAAVLFKIFQPV